MHDTAMMSGALFGRVYGKEGMTVLDVGGLDVNGSILHWILKNIQV